MSDPLGRYTIEADILTAKQLIGDGRYLMAFAQLNIIKSRVEQGIYERDAHRCTITEAVESWWKSRAERRHRGDVA